MKGSQGGLERAFGRCEEALHAATTLLAENLYSESISRSYYAVIHAVMLLLANRGEEIRNPLAAEERFTEEYVRGAGLDERLYQIFLEVRRAKAATAHDYLAKYSIEYARDSIVLATDFLDLTRALLGIEG